MLENHKERNSKEDPAAIHSQNSTILQFNRERSMFRMFFTISLFSFLYIGKAEAQTGKIVYPHAAFWHKTEINQFLDERWGVGFDLVYRRKNEMNKGSMFDHHLRTSLRPWINYQITKNSRFSLSPIGYMTTTEYVGKSSDYDRLPYHEWRTTFQLFHHHKYPNPRWMHTWRYRYELRWQENPGQSDYRFLTRFRLRYRLRFVINKPDFYQNNMLYLMASNEIGLNIGKNVLYNTFNQNRLYLGAGFRFATSARVELRYIDRIRTRGSTGIEFDHDKGFMIGIYVDQLSSLFRKNEQHVRYTD